MDSAVDKADIIQEHIKSNKDMNLCPNCGHEIEEVQWSWTKFWIGKLSKSSRRPFISWTAVPPHHRAYRSVHGGSMVSMQHF